jgi:hypothetical protein
MALFHPKTPILSRTYTAVFYSNAPALPSAAYLVVQPFEIVIEPGCTQIWFYATDYKTTNSSSTWVVQAQEESPGLLDWSGNGNPALSTPPGNGVVFPTPNPLVFEVPGDALLLLGGDMTFLNYPAQSDRPGTLKLWASGHGDMNPTSGGSGSPGTYPPAYLVVTQVIGNAQ